MDGGGQKEEHISSIDDHGGLQNVDNHVWLFTTSVIIHQGGIPKCEITTVYYLLCLEVS